MILDERGREGGGGVNKARYNGKGSANLNAIKQSAQTPIAISLNNLQYLLGYFRYVTVFRVFHISCSVLATKNKKMPQGRITHRTQKYNKEWRSEIINALIINNL